jgi:general secretion pathway protein K
MIASHSSQRGAALIMALLVVALATTLSSMMLWRQDMWLRQVEMQRDLAQTRLIAGAGIEWARAVLAYDARTSSFDHPGEPWAVKVPPSRVEGGEIGGEVTDEQGKWNLNNLLRGDGGTIANEQEVFRRLLRLLQLPPVLASALVDWLDADSELTPEGAEDAYYLSLSPPYRSANRALSDVDGLLRVRGFDANVVERLRPHVTALPGYHRVNVNTAGAMVLAALVPDLSLAEVQQLLVLRKNIPFRDFADFRTRLPRPDIVVNPAQLDTRSRFFSVRISARYERTALATEALLDRQGIDWPAIVWQKYE